MPRILDEDDLPISSTDVGGARTLNVYIKGGTVVTHVGQVTGATTLSLDLTAITDQTELTSPASGDFFLCTDATGANALRKVDFDNLPGAAGGISNIVEDTTPQLGGMLDVNGQAIGDGTLELIKFTEVTAAVNEITVANAITTASPSILATGDDTNIDLLLDGKGSGTVKTASSNLDITGDIVVSGTVDGVDIATDVAANTAKVSNYAHTGDVTGDTATTIDPSAISGKSLVTAVGADHVLILDATDSALKKALVSDLTGGGIASIVEDTTPQLGGMLDVNGQAIGDGTLELIKFTEVTSAVNEITIANAVTTGSPSILATGDDTNIDLLLDGKGSGTVKTLSSNLDITGNIVVSGTVDGIDIATDVAANTAKTTNATHTGDVTGSGALTIALDVAHAYTAQQGFALATLTDAATITWAAGTQQTAKVTLGGNRTLGAISGAVAGHTYVLIVIQDATGSRTLATNNAIYKWPGGTEPTLSTGANAIDVLTFVYDGTSMLGVSQLAFS